MDYRRYSLGSYARSKWVNCNECGTPDKPHPVWQGGEREVNVSFIINAIMQHEIAAHLSQPTKK